MMAAAQPVSAKRQKLIEKIVDQVAKEQKITYDDQQKAAIKQALEAPVLLLTGGPGTGKTTILNGIVRAYRRLLKRTAKSSTLGAMGNQFS